MLARCTSSLDLHMLIVPFWYLCGTLLVPKVATGRLLDSVGGISYSTPGTSSKHREETVSM